MANGHPRGYGSTLIAFAPGGSGTSVGYVLAPPDGRVLPET